jgi:glycosyltransferase involved in cell wall biosynthesis
MSRGPTCCDRLSSRDTDFSLDRRTPGEVTSGPIDSPAFTVVVPAYNAAETIAGTIRSVLAQSRPDFELLVVDDASVDGTPDLVRPFLADARVRLLTRPTNGGVSAARNAAIREARAPIVAFLDADDLWLPQYLQRMGEALDARPDAALAYTEAWMLDSRTGQFHRKTTSVDLQPGPREPPVERAALVAALLRSNFVFCSAAVRREIFEEIGPFDETMLAAEDYELWMRLALKGMRMVRVREPLVVYRRAAGSLSSDPLRLEAHRREVFKRVAESADVSEATRALAAKQVSRADRRLATLSGRLPVLSALYRTRRRFSPVKHRLFGRFLRHPTAPAPIANAFAEFRTGGSGSGQGS